METGILVGIFTVIGTLCGIFLGHILNNRQQAKARRAEYARVALNPLRANLGRMEVTARHIIFILVSLRMGVSRTQKTLMKKSLEQIQSDLMTTSLIPEVLDTRLEDSWLEVARNFGALIVTYSSESPNLIPIAGAERRPRTELLEQYQKIFGADDFTAIGSLIAPEPESKVIFEASTRLIAAIVKCREEIRRLSTES